MKLAPDGDFQFGCGIVQMSDEGQGMIWVGLSPISN